MSDPHMPNPDEEHLIRLLAESGDPQQAARSLLERLEALEAAVASLTARIEDAGGAPDAAGAGPEA